jgi:hypothetical protein
MKSLLQSLALSCLLAVPGMGVPKDSHQTPNVNPGTEKEQKALTLEEKVFGLSLIWKEAEYNFPFWKNLKDLDWDSAYLEALKNVSKTNDTREYYLELSRFMALLNDGHTNIVFPESLLEQVGRFPVSLDYICGKFYIGTCDKNLDIDVNTEVLKINKMNAHDYYKNVIYPYIWHEKMDSSFSNINRYMALIEYGKELEITTQKRTFKLKAMPMNTINWKQKIPLSNKGEQLTKTFESPYMNVEITNDNIAIITFPTFMDWVLRDEFVSILPKIENCKGFIIDLRNNYGGQSYLGFDIAAAFMDDKKFPLIASREFVRLGAWTTYLGEQKTMSPNNARITLTLEQPMVILVNQTTGSAAEDFLIPFDALKRATIVGIPTNGSSGTPKFLNLPGGGGARICTQWHSYPDGREYINTGVQPHIRAELSIDDVKNGNDSVFKKGIDALREKINLKTGK